MGRIVFSISVSLDGFFEGPDREIDWHLVDDEVHQHFNDWLREAGAFLEGRVTYELMAGYWPHAGEDPAATPVEKDFARIWVDMPKIAFSRTLDEDADWNTVVWRDVDAKEIAKLKERTEGDLVVGGPDLAASFAALDLIDEYRIYVHPVLIGRGRPFFPTTDARTRLRLAGTHTFGNGVVLLHYGRATADGSSPGSPD
ncbi:dihydrofolate reductase family protein [Georgenia sp. EYE_87]|uniref:dihydrofolate reductase family protein n=1 Tax=Georgenia sp. EYE_87 TaxID=2853448 RepID=UPI002004F1FB|nr:dihydrofolate reductase family protein [Georgenia sp. EYE_87]MCK6210163.1 dihydrofolate reductase family protein [Georgenia sp. EYE_87]